MSDAPLDGILIDDDPLIHMAWEIAAESASKRVRCYSSPKEFFAAASSYPHSTPVYIDRNLGNGLNGEEVSREIADMGFDNIYLATAYPANFFQSMPWLRGVVGKDPPFRRRH